MDQAQAMAQGSQRAPRIRGSQDQAPGFVVSEFHSSDLRISDYRCLLGSPPDAI